MGLSHSPSIITNGLSLFFDPGNTKSYPGSGATLTDYVNSQTTTLVNSPTYSTSNGGMLTFNGSTQYATPSALTDSFLQGSWTMFFWCNWLVLETGGNSANDRPMLQHGTTATDKGMHLTQRSSKVFYGFYGDDFTSTATLTTSRWYNVVFTYNSSSRFRQIYLNGIFDSSFTGNTYTGTGSNARLFGPLLFGNYFNGYIGQCLFYNRRLAADEINQNFNALRGRYRI
jgi:hypothetical protein